MPWLCHHGPVANGDSYRIDRAVHERWVKRLKCRARTRGAGTSGIASNVGRAGTGFRWAAKLVSIGESASTRVPGSMAGSDSNTTAARNTPAGADGTLATDIPAIWHAPTTTSADRKHLIRHLVEQVRAEVPAPARR